MMTSAELRERFLNYFREHDHTVVLSSSLIPQNDPTLLFTNAGMVQFKDVFLGLEKRQYTRAASSQRCVRAGGKHNDLENVGYTARHHTFFEMLGNFSFGDYFKERAIEYAWNFLTKELKISPGKLWITVYEEDDEAAKIWAQQKGVTPERIIRCGAKDNFWSMGDTGPCGPCTEIYYDHGEHIPGGLPGTPAEDGDRYIEIWNLVFMQYERHPDGSLTPLPKPSVDTGMGLERISAVMQGVHNNYDIDLFKHLIAAASSLRGTLRSKATWQSQEYGDEIATAASRPRNDRNEGAARNNKLDEAHVLSSLRVLADHIRSTAFLIMDSVIPANEGRGYVLRRIIRRAIRHGYQLNIPSPFFYRLVQPLVEVMGGAYPELKKSQSFIEKTLQREEELFANTLDQGMKILNQAIQQLSSNTIPGDVVFRLYDTFGFPVDLTADIARGKNLIIDIAGFETEMEKQRQQSQNAQKFSSEQLTQVAQHLKDHQCSEFTGYLVTEEPQVTVTALIKDDHQKVIGVILDRTPFYAESGGQVGDQGVIENKQAIFIVNDTRKIGQHIVHYGEVKKGEFKEQLQVVARVNQQLRQAIRLNHTATHLLHAALRKVLGEHVQQKGSLVAPDRLRFDFSHLSPLTENEIKQLEQIVNAKIRENIEGHTEEMTPEEAAKKGAMALFGEKYGDRVRTLRYGDFSYEVCGGTHVERTGDIGAFKIIAETGIAAGVRRIEAITGAKAIEWIENVDHQLREAASLLKADRESLINKLQQLLDQQRQLQKENDQLKSKLASKSGDDLLDKVQNIAGTKLLTAQIEHADSKTLRDMADQLKNKLGSGIVALASVQDHKANLIVGVTKDLTEKFPANKIINEMAGPIGGKGGGRPDMAQAGGDKPENLAMSFAAVTDFILRLSK
jgi:alanyl-tRNA synthetase